MCAVVDDIAIALHVTVDELVGLRRGWPASPEGSRPGISLRSEVSAEVANSSSLVSAS